MAAEGYANDHDLGNLRTAHGVDPGSGDRPTGASDAVAEGYGGETAQGEGRADLHRARETDR